MFDIPENLSNLPRNCADCIKKRASCCPDASCPFCATCTKNVDEQSLLEDELK